MPGFVAVLLVAALCCCQEAYGETRWVSPDGSHPAPCSQTRPCLSLSRAADMLAPGDTLRVRAGAGGDRRQRALLEAAARKAGRHGGIVSAAGGDRRLVWGYVRLATTYSSELRPVFPSAAVAVPNLVDAVNAQTRIAAAVGKHVFIGTREFHRQPFAYITADHAFLLTESEMDSLGRYLREGGFVLADNAMSAYPHSQAEAALRHMFQAALGRAGRLRRIPDSHPIYSCFYDFNGPPPGLDEAPGSYDLEGVFLNGSLVAVYSDHGYVHSWAQSSGNEPQLRLGINAVVYALTRPGSMARQVHLLSR